uniref:Cell division protein FtsX n=1 Tax=Eiseniibacteriota bacterium TaxID=2212470 RepID=A0A832MMY4_UNCEI
MHLFYLREAWRSFLQHRGLSFTAMISLFAALTVSGLFLLLSHNADRALRLIGDRREMVVYLKDGVPEPARESLVQTLERLYGTVTYVSKERAWEEFARQVGDPALLEAVDENPLPASLRVKLRPELLHYDAMEEAARQVAEFPEVEDVRYGAEWVRRLDDLNEALRRGTFAAGLVVALAIVFVMHNTIRLTVLARRPQVEIMSRLGASDRFIATPFVIEALIQAAGAALAALAAVYGLQQAVAAQVGGVTFLPPAWAAAFLGAALALAWLAALLALSRVLRAVGP